MKRTKDDISWRLEYTGMAAVTSGLEYVINVANRLFFMIPGIDDYNKDMGLDIQTRAQRAAADGSRDTEYEQMIMQQFRTYTDIIPTGVVAIYQGHLLMIHMTAVYNGEDFQLKTSSDPNRLATQILPKEIFPK